VRNWKGCRFHKKKKWMDSAEPDFRVITREALWMLEMALPSAEDIDKACVTVQAIPWTLPAYGF